jgi:hypothetical protein
MSLPLMRPSTDKALMLSLSKHEGLGTEEG